MLNKGSILQNFISAKNFFGWIFILKVPHQNNRYNIYGQ
jgi:hypothetical protein